PTEFAALSLHDALPIWMLEGVGNIVEVDEDGYHAGRGYKVDSKYAVSYTDYHEHTVSRGTKDCNDDFTIRPGQTWCVVTAAVERSEEHTSELQSQSNLV